MGTKHLRQAQQFATDALVELYTLDISRYGGPVLRWTPGPLGGSSQNLLPNHSFRVNTNGWTRSTSGVVLGPAAGYGAAYVLPNFGSGHLRWPGTLASNVGIRSNESPTQTNDPAEAGQWWEAQARVVPIRCRARVDLIFMDSTGAATSSTLSPLLENTTGAASANRLDDYTVLHARAQAPAGTTKVRMQIIMQPLVGGGSTDPAIVFTMAQIARVHGRGSGQPHPWSEPRASGAPSNVAFGGISYTPFPLLIEGISWTTRGAMPRPRVTVPDIDSYFTQLLVGYENLLACPVSRTRVFASNLDGGPDPDSTSFFGPETWYVDRVARHRAGEEVVLELANPLDLQGKMLPGRQVIRDSCTHVYRKHNGTTFVMGSCPYAGGSFFKADGTVTIFPGEDSCGKRLKDCKLRFPNAALPTRAFPGVGKYRT